MCLILMWEAKINREKKFCNHFYKFFWFVLANKGCSEYVEQIGCNIKTLGAF